MRVQIGVLRDRGNNGDFAAPARFERVETQVDQAAVIGIDGGEKIEAGVGHDRDARDGKFAAEQRGVGERVRLVGEYNSRKALFADFGTERTIRLASALWNHVVVDAYGVLRPGGVLNTFSDKIEVCADVAADAGVHQRVLM